MKADEEKTLNLLRNVWKESNSFRTRLENEVPQDEWALFKADVLGWTERVKLILRSVFFNVKFRNDYEEILQKAYDGEFLDPTTAISLTQTYIRTIGQLYKAGYVKDPYSGISNEDSQICFVAMWFDAQMEEVFANGIKAPIEQLGYNVVRVDKEQYNGRVDQKILELIRKARFLVADLTGGRGGVYYESGFASGQGSPVIQTCRSDYFDERHFDVLTVNTIKYDNSAELAMKLQERVEATIGRYSPKASEISMPDDFPF